MILKRLKHKIPSTSIEFLVSPPAHCFGASCSWTPVLNAAAPRGSHPSRKEDSAIFVHRLALSASRSGSARIRGSIPGYQRSSFIPHSQRTMAYLLPGLRRGLMLSTPLILSTPLLVSRYRHPVFCESVDPLANVSSDLRSGFARGSPAQIKQSGLSPRNARQISLGSILGVLAGLGVSVFSKPLAVIIGLGIVCVQVRRP